MACNNVCKQITLVTHDCAISAMCTDHWPPHTIMTCGKCTTCRSAAKRQFDSRKVLNPAILIHFLCCCRTKVAEALAISAAGALIRGGQEERHAIVASNVPANFGPLAEWCATLIRAVAGDGIRAAAARQ